MRLVNDHQAQPINKYLQAQAIYNPSATRSESDTRAFNYDPVFGAYTQPESTLSNSYENRNTVQNGGIALLFTKGVWKLLTNTSYQRTELNSEQTFPASRTVDHTFQNFLVGACGKGCRGMSTLPGCWLASR